MIGELCTCGRYSRHVDSIIDDTFTECAGKSVGVTNPGKLEHNFSIYVFYRKYV